MTQVKKRILYVILSILVVIYIIIAISFSIMVIRFIHYRNQEKPWDVPSVIWYSEDPKIEIIKDENHCWQGYLIKDEEKIEVNLAWGPEFSYEIYHRDASLPEDEISPDENLLVGSLSYNGEYVTLKIETDKVYDYKYKEIILYKRAIEHGEST